MTKMDNFNDLFNTTETACQEEMITGTKLALRFVSHNKRNLVLQREADGTFRLMDTLHEMLPREPLPRAPRHRQPIARFVPSFKSEVTTRKKKLNRVSNQNFSVVAPTRNTRSDTSDDSSEDDSSEDESSGSDYIPNKRSRRRRIPALTEDHSATRATTRATTRAAANQIQDSNPNQNHPEGITEDDSATRANPRATATDQAWVSNPNQLGAQDLPVSPHPANDEGLSVSPHPESGHNNEQELPVAPHLEDSRNEMSSPTVNVESNLQQEILSKKRGAGQINTESSRQNEAEPCDDGAQDLPVFSHPANDEGLSVSPHPESGHNNEQELPVAPHLEDSRNEMSSPTVNVESNLQQEILSKKRGAGQINTESSRQNEVEPSDDGDNIPIKKQRKGQARPAAFTPDHSPIRTIATDQNQPRNQNFSVVAPTRNTRSDTSDDSSEDESSGSDYIPNKRRRTRRIPALTEDHSATRATTMAAANQIQDSNPNQNQPALTEDHSATRATTRAAANQIQDSNPNQNQLEGFAEDDSATRANPRDTATDQAWVSNPNEPGTQHLPVSTHLANDEGLSVSPHPESGHNNEQELPVAPHLEDSRNEMSSPTVNVESNLQQEILSKKRGAGQINTESSRQNEVEPCDDGAQDLPVFSHPANERTGAGDDYTDSSEDNSSNSSEDDSNDSNGDDSNDSNGDDSTDSDNIPNKKQRKGQAQPAAFTPDHSPIRTIATDQNQPCPTGYFLVSLDPESNEQIWPVSAHPEHSRTNTEDDPTGQILPVSPHAEITTIDAEDDYIDDGNDDSSGPEIVIGHIHAIVPSVGIKYNICDGGNTQEWRNMNFQLFRGLVNEKMGVPENYNGWGYTDDHGADCEMDSPIPFMKMMSLVIRGFNILLRASELHQHEYNIVLTHYLNKIVDDECRERVMNAINLALSASKSRRHLVSQEVGNETCYILQRRG